MKLHEQIKAKTSHVGDQVRYHRKLQKLTLAQLSEKIGCKYQHLQRIELTGKGSIRSLEEIAEALQTAIYIAPKIYFKKSENKFVNTIN